VACKRIGNSPITDLRRFIGLDISFSSSIIAHCNPFLNVHCNPFLNIHCNPFLNIHCKDCLINEVMVLS
jgi:hypothetical protein